MAFTTSTGNEHRGRPVVSTRFEPSELEKLRQLATERGRTVPDLVRESMRERLEREGLAS